MTALEQMCAALSPLAGGGGRVLAALDGPCASGKTTLAGQAARQLGCPLVHMDDFFLPPARKTPARLAQPGGKCGLGAGAGPGPGPPVPGRARPVLPLPLPYRGVWAPVSLSPAPLVLVEGVYALHPALRDFYRLRIFLEAPWPVRRARLLDRGGPELLARLPGGVGPAGGPVFPGLSGPGLLPAGAERSMTRAPSPLQLRLAKASYHQ